MTLLLVPVAAFFLTVMLVPVVARLARQYKLLAHPSFDRWHAAPVPNVGGAAMFVAIVGVIGVTGIASELAPLVALASVMYGIGLADDLHPLRPATKLVLQMAAAAIFLSLLPALRITGVGAIDLALGFVWIVGITNAVNLLDNIDGLAAGVSALAGTFFLAVLLLDSGGAPPAIALATAALVGAAAGFLLYNFQPASIFMGDGGSHLLGSFLAGATLLAAPSLGSQLAPIAAIPVLLLLIPIFDTAFVTVARGLAGRSAFLGGRDHTSHRLVALGIGERRAVLVLYAFTCIGGGVALGFMLLSPRVAWTLAGFYVMLLGTIGVYLGHIEVARGDGQPGAPLPTEVTDRYRAYEAGLDALLLFSAYYLAFLARFREPQFSEFLPYFTRSVPLVVGLQLGALWLSGKYRRVWRNLDVGEIFTLAREVLFGTAAAVIAVLYLTRFVGYSRSVFIFDAILAPVLIIGARVVLSGLDQYLRRQRYRGRTALVYGAGRGGALATRELLQNQTIGLTPLGFLDDDPAKRRLKIDGLPVLGSLEDLPALLDRSPQPVAAVIVSITELSAERFERVCAICAARGVSIRRMRFSLEDVRRRPPRESRVVGFPRS